jgi:hypothetical protein
MEGLDESGGDIPSTNGFLNGQDVARVGVAFDEDLNPLTQPDKLIPDVSNASERLPAEEDQRRSHRSAAPQHKLTLIWMKCSYVHEMEKPDSCHCSQTLSSVKWSPPGLTKFWRAVSAVRQAGASARVDKRECKRPELPSSFFCFGR